MVLYIALFVLFTIFTSAIVCFLRGTSFMRIYSSAPQAVLIPFQISMAIFSICAVLFFVKDIQLLEIPILYFAMGLMSLMEWPLIIYVLFRKQDRAVEIATPAISQPVNGLKS